MIRLLPAWPLALLLLSVPLHASAPPPAPPQSPPQAPPRTAPVDYTRDVRPILADRCLQCHGPDAATRKAGLRLDERAGATAKLRSGDRAVAPGHPDASELLARVVSDDDSQVMPPPKVGKRLTPAEVDTLRRWIAQGAPYAAHWAYVTPVRPAVPAPAPTKTDAWVRNPVDAFLLARLRREGLRPSAPAEPLALLRRAAIDLTGLPPTIAEADAFLADAAPGAYERAVDRLLASPAFGERWAGPWLDLARYADSQGYANDPDRTIWPWRDWVIQALNDNKPYDAFTLEQLAGDLLPGASAAQKLATGFHRNTLTNTEGGTSAEEFRTAAVVDRVNTTFQVWLASTFACAQCHTHKYDPFTQKEYYQVFAIFNSQADANGGDDAPRLTVPAPGREAEHAAVTADLAARRRDLDALAKKLDAGLEAWEKSADRAKLPKPIQDILAVPAAKRNGGQKQQLLAHHRGLDDAHKTLDQQVKDQGARLKALTLSSPVLQEIKPRPTNVLIRGNFLDKGDPVTPGLPAALPGARPDKPDRLALARWLVAAENPLTARVAVNRLWEEVFGVGLVETSEDFGTQGELPSHPELLDWLAVDYRESGWDTKRLLRLLVTSAAYRQTSLVTPELTARDPANRLLARGPRVRLSAEGVRDQALFAGGLLSRTMFGPPVQPPQPRFGLSAAFGSSTDWNPSAGEDVHRRGLYTRWRRNAPYPSMTTFDAPERTSCTSRRIRTNTPLQALVTLNDPVYIEAAQALARRTLKEAGPAPRDRVVYAFRTALTRPPSPAEAERLERLVEAARLKYKASPAEALAFATRPIGPAPAGADVAELAAWTLLANVLLNLDETLAKR